MNTLRDFYKTWLQWTAVGFGFLSAIVTTYITESVLSRILLSGIFLGILFYIAEWLIRNKIWRWSVFHRELDFEDTWYCVTFYKGIESRNKKCIDTFREYHIFHLARIRQECRGVSIESSTGENYNSWESLLMSVTSKGSIEYVYEVRYNDQSIARGYEELAVMQRDKGNKGKPIVLAGRFAHCSEGQIKALRGTAVFFSSTYFSKINEKTLTAPNIKEALKVVKEKIFESD